jgi:DNA invertase Pin-like site-specific DNA recombinase
VLCSLSGVLLADPDGVYDPGIYNDRLLPGLKGTMSEAELLLIRHRMLSGRLAKAERGELAVPLPTGYVRRPPGEAVLDPDEQAQHVLRLVFGAFRRLGTLNGVLRYLVGQGIQLPVRVHSGPSKGELEWRRPTRETLQLMQPAGIRGLQGTSGPPSPAGALFRFPAGQGRRAGHAACAP